MNNAVRKPVIILAFFLGFFMGMISEELTIPVIGRSDTPYYHGNRGKNQISLTFNVDWGSEFIPAILDSLEEKGVGATFFVTGSWAAKNQELLKKIAAKGHEIGNHGYQHQHPSRLDREGLTGLILKNEELIRGITGRKTTLFAPPYGEVDSRISAIAGSLGYKTIMWSADTVDWQRPAPEIIIQRAVNKVSDGGIILMHPTAPSTAALPEIIRILAQRGYRFVTVSELLS